MPARRRGGAPPAAGQRMFSGRTKVVRRDEEEEEEISGDEVDAFERQRGEVSLGRGKIEEVEEDYDEEEEVEAMPLRGYQEGEDDGDDDGETERSVDASEARRDATQSWGHTKSTYYQGFGRRGVEGEDDDEGEDDGDFAKRARRQQRLEAEEAEAARIQRIRAARLTAEDFEANPLGADAAPNAEQESKVSGAEKVEMEEMMGDASDGEERVHRDLSGLTEEEKARIVSRESPELAGLLADFYAKKEELEGPLRETVQRLRAGQAEASPERSLAELKYSLYAQYCMNASFYLMLKAKGKDVRDHPVVTELVRLRSILAKLRSIEKRLHNRVERLDGEDREEPREAEVDGEDNLEEADEDEDDDEDGEPGQEDEGDLEGLEGDLTGSRAKVRDVFGDDADDLDDDHVRADGVQGWRKRELTQMVNQIAQESSSRGLDATRRKRLHSGDQDLPLPATKRGRKVPSSEESGAVEGANGMGEEALAKMEREEQKAAMRSRRREKKKVRIQEKVRAADERMLVPEGQKRSISRRIEKNRGLTRTRPLAEGTTPHARIRAKFAKKVKAARGAMPALRDKTKPYTGETAIRPRVVHSRQFA